MLQRLMCGFDLWRYTSHNDSGQVVHLCLCQQYYTSHMTVEPCGRESYSRSPITLNGIKMGEACYTLSYLLGTLDC